VNAKGALVVASTSAAAVLRGVNWFGWEVGQHNPDGLWSFCDDNATTTSPPCQSDGEIPPYSYPSAAIGQDEQNNLQLYYWKRRMTNDFATVVWRLKLLGLNAVRLPFTFSALTDDLKDYSEFYACVVSPLFALKG